jgi:hypothetical protein
MPSASFTIKNDPPGLRALCTSEKHFSSPGQKYIVSKAVARSYFSSNPSFDTSPFVPYIVPSLSSPH